MRPRVFPAEDVCSCGNCPVDTQGFNEAAGIPRGRLPSTSLVHHQQHPASMRPRVFPAEDLRTVAVPFTEHDGFNEAAGIPRGRLASGRLHHEIHVASMRPRVFPAEDPYVQHIT